jgi:hypothetical protein
MRIASLTVLFVLALGPNLGQAQSASGQKAVTTFMHQTMGESIEDFMRISGSKMCGSGKAEAAEWCAVFKKIEAGEDGTVIDENDRVSASLIFSGRKLVQVSVQGSADWPTCLAQFTQTYGKPDEQTANSATWVFADGGGITVNGPPGDRFSALFYSKERNPNIGARTPAQPSNSHEIASVSNSPSSSDDRSQPKLIGGHTLGESVDEFAAKIGVNIGACRQLDFSAAPRDLEKQAKKLQVFAETCKGLLGAEQGQRLEIGKPQEWSAVLDYGKLVSFYDGHVDSDKIIPVDKLPPPPAEAYELKGDKLGMSMAEYLKRHPSDCVSSNLAPKPSKTGPKPADPSSFHFTCTNIDVTHPYTLATYPMKWQSVDFSRQQLYRIEYAFSHELFDVIEASLASKFGQPTNMQQDDVQNGFGAHFKRSTVIWKNGTSTITLNEIIAGDLTVSDVELTLDTILSAVKQKEGEKAVSAVKKDM